MQKLDEEHAEGLDGAGDEEVDDEGGEQDHPAPAAVRRDQLRPPRLPPRRHGLLRRGAGGPARTTSAAKRKKRDVVCYAWIVMDTFCLPSPRRRRERLLSLLKDRSA